LRPLKTAGDASRFWPPMHQLCRGWVTFRCNLSCARVSTGRVGCSPTPSSFSTAGPARSSGSWFRAGSRRTLPQCPCLFAASCHHGGSTGTPRSSMIGCTGTSHCHERPLIGSCSKACGPSMCGLRCAGPSTVAFDSLGGMHGPATARTRAAASIGNVRSFRTISRRRRRSLRPDPLPSGPIGAIHQPPHPS